MKLSNISEAFATPYPSIIPLVDRLADDPSYKGLIEFLDEVNSRAQEIWKKIERPEAFFDHYAQIPYDYEQREEPQQQQRLAYISARGVQTEVFWLIHSIDGIVKQYNKQFGMYTSDYHNAIATQDITKMIEILTNHILRTRSKIRRWINLTRRETQQLNPELIEFFDDYIAITDWFKNISDWLNKVMPTAIPLNARGGKKPKYMS